MSATLHFLMLSSSALERPDSLPSDKLAGLESTADECVCTRFVDPQGHSRKRTVCSHRIFQREFSEGIIYEEVGRG